MTPQKSPKRSLILTAITFCLALILLQAIKTNYQITKKYGSWDHYREHARLNKENPHLAEELDADRNTYKINVETAPLYQIKDTDYVESVSAEVVYDDNRVGESTPERMGYWSNYDRVYVTVQLSKDFRSIPEIDKTYILLSINDEIEQNLADLYHDSDYYKLFDQYKCEKTGLLDYKDHGLDLFYWDHISFTDGSYEYTVSHYGLTVTTKSGRMSIYDFDVKNGEIVNFKLYERGTIDADGSFTSDSDRKKSQDTNSTTSSGKRDTTGSSSGSYDPYDVHDYDTADDFADDKYEEFYDYEDEYEDEDEAYDAAEDYWYDEY